jgi:hypothetical protein
MLGLAGPACEESVALRTLGPLEPFAAAFR